MSMSPKLKSFIIATFSTMQYEFKNEAVSELPDKLVITASNPLVCYLIFKVSYTNPLLIIGNEFKVPKEISFINDSK